MELNAQDNKDDLEITTKGEFDYIHVKHVNCATGYLHKQLTTERSKQDKPKPFLEQIDLPHNGVGGGNGRIWIGFLGNLHGVVGIPLWMLKDDFAREFFPVLSTCAVRDVLNKYAPGCYIKKFPNDAVCIEHQRKTAGFLCRKEGKYALLVLCINLVKAPDDEQLRKEGLKACCLKNHTSNVPPIDQIFYDIATRTLELCNKEITDVDKMVEFMNESHTKYEKKSLRVVINNRNADIMKDGVLWGKNSPNALIRGYLNGLDYEYMPYLYDTAFFKESGPADESREFEKMIEKQQREGEAKKKSEQK